MKAIVPYNCSPWLPAVLAIAWSISCWVHTTAQDAKAQQLSVREQQALAERLSQKVQRSEIWTDDAGNVTGLIFINHQSLDETAGAKPGISDDDLRQLPLFPRLTAINVEAQPLTDRGMEVLRTLPALKQVGFHYMAKAKGANVSADFITVIDGMQSLEILEIKHNFHVDAVNVDKLHGPYPLVWRLVLDTPLTAAQTMHLIGLCPNVRDLQLHRTEISAEQVAAIGGMLPKLEVFWFKPKGELLAGHLQALQHFPELRIYSPQHATQSVPYEDGWEALRKSLTMWLALMRKPSSDCGSPCPG
jgi:hypothetical protein